MTFPSTADWHARFLQQAAWTQETRNHLYRRASLLQAERVLDVGCGTGVLTEELARRCRGQVTGVDVDPDMLAAAQGPESKAVYEQGRAEALPFPERHFDLAACHWLLMWVADPVQAVAEMARVVRPGGAILICAEPDYGGRVDWPDMPIRQWQIDGLRRQGADPLIGRRLRQIAAAAGLRAQVGVIPSLWDHDALRAHQTDEWAWLQRDAGDGVDPLAFRRAQEADRAAIEDGSRLLYLPIFYALIRIQGPRG